MTPTPEIKAAIEDDVFTKSANPFPTAWEIICPSCERCYGIDCISEDFTGAYTPDDEDKFYLCECGCNIEIAGVTVQPLTALQPAPATQAEGMAGDVERLICNYTRNDRNAVNRFLGAAEMCGYALVRADLARTPAQAVEVESLRKHAPSGEAIVEYRGSDTEIFDTGWNNCLDHLFLLGVLDSKEGA